MESYKFEKFIKIRIGEPLTAVDLNQNGLIFGSISGYIGFMSFHTFEVKYLPEIYDELVRAENKAYCALGDYQGLVLTFPSSKCDAVPNIRVISYADFREHNTEICSNTLAFLAGNLAALITANPTQNKDIERRSDKNNVFLINYETSIASKLDPLGFSTFTVPFDFDGTRVVWLEYKEKSIKELVVHDLYEKANIFSQKFDKHTEFISHCKLLKTNQMVYVEENRQVRLLNLLTKEVKTLYSHNKTVMALDFYCPDDPYKIREAGGNLKDSKDRENPDNIIVQIEERNDKKNKEGNPLVNIKAVPGFAIFSIDYDGELIAWKSDQMVHRFNVLSLSNFPENLKKQRLLFDMGYPYYIKSNGTSIAFTTDFGLCVLNLGSKL